MNIHTKRALAILGTEVVLAASFLTSGAIGLRTASAHPGHEEDEPGWSCSVDGNRICGDGIPAGTEEGGR